MNVQPPKMEYPISKLTSFTEYPDIIRRRGVVSIIKFVLSD